MKKIFVILFSTLLLMGSFQNSEAQVKDKFFAAGLHTGLNHGSLDLGLNADFNADNFRGRVLIDGSLIFESFYFAPAIDIHWLFNLVDGLYAYPIAGLNAAIYKGFNVGIDLGAGLEYRFDYHWGLFLEGKYQPKIIGTSTFNGGYNAIFGFTYSF